ncbi:MAG: hypothetical protein HZB95_10665 [Nitrosomonadales bacterium]|nr:hypothetical protein [Nitrosomonadales bacterium]
MIHLPRSFYKSGHAPYYIVALDYIQQSAGIRALHYLCHALNESGAEAYLTCQVTAPHLRTPVLDGNILQRHHLAGRKPIVIYPEIVSGDPMGAGGLVVRWLLNQPGHIAGDLSFPDSDLIFAYSPMYLPSGMQGRILHVPTCDLALFNNDDNPHDAARDQVCFYAHKYLVNGGTLTRHANDAVSLCKDRKLTHAEIAAVLRRSRLLYVYEPTALITEALLCGCAVAIVETDYWRDNVGSFSCPVEDGMTMDLGPDAIACAQKNARNFRTKYENSVMREAWLQLDRFVNYTQAVFKERTGR